MNVFQKCLRRQMGTEAYLKYLEVFEENMEKNRMESSKTPSGNPVFEKIYDDLKKENQNNLLEKVRDVKATLAKASRINRCFLSVLIVYVLANLVLLALDLNYYVTCASILLMGICFLYKLLEFLCNKYCILDAYLFVLYKSALEKLISTTS